MGNLWIYDGAQDIKAKPTTHTVAAISCGISTSFQSDSLNIRKNGHEGWSLFYCERGCVEFEDASIQPGEVWIYEPGVEQRYATYQKDKTVYHYLHFTGNGVKELLTSLNIPFSTPVKVNKNGVLDVFEQLATESKNDDPFSLLCTEYLILLLFTYIAKREVKRSDQKMMKIVIDKMEHSFAEDYDAKTYADMLYISVDRFQHLFKEHVGQSPYAYYIGLRMENAVKLLTETSLKIKDIAKFCGYDDALYFSQAFKTVKGITPSVYRKMYKSNIGG